MRNDLYIGLGGTYHRAVNEFKKIYGCRPERLWVVDEGERSTWWVGSADCEQSVLVGVVSGAKPRKAGV